MSSQMSMKSLECFSQDLDSFHHLNRPVQKAKKNKSEIFSSSSLMAPSPIDVIEPTPVIADEESVAQEVQSTLNRLRDFFRKNVLSVIIRIFECFWMIVLNLISWPLKWNLMVCQYLLSVILKGLCCVGCFGCMGCMKCGKSYLGSIQTEVEVTKAKSKAKGCKSRKKKSAAAQEKLLVLLDIDQTLVYSTTLAPRVQAKYFEVYDSIRNE